MNQTSPRQWTHLHQQRTPVTSINLHPLVFFSSQQGGAYDTYFSIPCLSESSKLRCFLTQGLTSAALIARVSVSPVSVTPTISFYLHMYVPGLAG